MSTVPDSNAVSFDVDDLVDVRPDDEGLFARDVDGQLIRVEKATAAELDQDIKLTIDGREVTVKKAVPTPRSAGSPGQRPSVPQPQIRNLNPEIRNLKSVT